MRIHQAAGRAGSSTKAGRGPAGPSGPGPVSTDHPAPSARHTPWELQVERAGGRLLFGVGLQLAAPLPAASPAVSVGLGVRGGAQASQHVTATRVKGLGSQESSPQHMQMGSPPPPLGCASSAHEWLWKVPEARYWTPLRYTPHAGYRDSPSQHGPELGFGKCFEDELSSGVRLC